MVQRLLRGNRILKKIFKWFVYFHVFLALVLVLTHCSVTKQTERSYAQARKEKPYDVIIVPGVAVRQSEHYFGDDNAAVLG